MRNTNDISSGSTQRNCKIDEGTIDQTIGYGAFLISKDLKTIWHNGFV
jgi:hypothetical protein